MGLYTIPKPLSSKSDSKKDSPRKEVLYKGYYYDVTNFIERHPGGVELLEYYTQPGEDGTIPISQFHHRSQKKVQLVMKSLKRRKAEELDPSKVTPVELVKAEKNKAMTDDFFRLFEELEKEGYFEPNVPFLIWRIIEVVLLMASGYFVMFTWASIPAQVLSILLIGLAHGRVGFIIHELGHFGSTADKKTDTLIGKLLIGMGWGMSFTWWNFYHSPHHAMAQRLHRDRAVEPFEFMISNIKSVEEEPAPIRKQLIKNQKFHLFLDTFFGLFILQAQSLQTIWETKNLLEIACVAVHIYLSSFLGLWQFLLSRFFWSAYSFGQVALSHSHLPVAEEPAHWAEYALVYTVNMSPSKLITWWTGYLNFQIEHHLFPTMPDYQLPKVVGRVKEFAKKHNLPYQVMSYPEAVVRTVTSFWDVSVQLNKLFE